MSGMKVLVFLVVTAPSRNRLSQIWCGCVCGVHVSNQAAEVFLKDGSLNDGPDDEAFNSPYGGP